jgi:hypothetical protein
VWVCVQKSVQDKWEDAVSGGGPLSSGGDAMVAVEEEGW